MNYFFKPSIIYTRDTKDRETDWVTEWATVSASPQMSQRLHIATKSARLYDKRAVITPPGH